MQSLKKVVRLQKKNSLFVFLSVTLGILFAFSVSLSGQPAETAYVDASLSDSADSLISVIITADSADTAVAAVEQVGGQVTSNLWLVDAVGATVSPAQLKALAASPGIVSIVNNKGIANSQGNGNGNDGNVRVTQRNDAA
jgi:hypothetical protein